MLSDTLLEKLAKSNDSEAALLEKLKEGVGEIFDDMIAGTFTRKLELDCLVESLAKVRQEKQDGARNIQPLDIQSIANSAHSARSINDGIRECKKAIEESYDRYSTTSMEALEKRQYQTKDWEKEKEEKVKRKEKADKLEKLCNELGSRGLWSLHNRAVEIMMSDQEERYDHVDVAARDCEQKWSEEEIMDKAWSVHAKEKEVLQTQIQRLQRIARTFGFKLDK